MLTFGSLFSGIGGFDLGLERAGMQCAWQVERDPFCQQVLAKHWPHVQRYGDIHDVGKHNLQPVDLICGGFPCQPFSDAGERRGAADDRNLWPQMLRLVQELKPRWVVGENVAGFIGLYLDRVLADLEVEGYEAWTVVLPAIAFGAPHVRARVFVVAHSEQQQGGERCDADLFGGRKGEAQQVRVGGGAEPLADGEREQQPRGPLLQERRRIGDSSEEIALAHAHGKRCEELLDAALPSGTEQHQWCPASAGHHWAVEPAVGRVAHGVPRRMDRLRALGNAVVPQVVEHIGRCILEVERKLA